jgi:prolyl-tRNA editing enzyme YbaK/EbsC (Cys-tRNA(Pro) deacylase)
MSTAEPHSVIGALRAAGVEFTLHRHAPARNFYELHLTGLDVATSAKTLAFTLVDGRTVLAAIPGLAKLRYPHLASALGVSRSALRPATAETLAALGMAPGGVAPFTTDPDVVLVLERTLIDLAVLYCGGGSPELSVELSPAALLQVMPSAILADLCAPPA